MKLKLKYRRLEIFLDTNFDAKKYSAVEMYHMLDLRPDSKYLLIDANNFWIPFYLRIRFNHYVPKQ